MVILTQVLLNYQGAFIMLAHIATTGVCELCKTNISDFDIKQIKSSSQEKSHS